MQRQSPTALSSTVWGAWGRAARFEAISVVPAFVWCRRESLPVALPTHQASCVATNPRQASGCRAVGWPSRCRRCCSRAPTTRWFRPTPRPWSYFVGCWCVGVVRCVVVRQWIVCLHACVVHVHASFLASRRAATKRRTSERAETPRHQEARPTTQTRMDQKLWPLSLSFRCKTKRLGWTQLTARQFHRLTRFDVDA